MNQEPSFTFTTPLNVNIVEVKGVEQTFVEGDISTTDIDFVNDIMSKKCQDSMMKQILDRNMKLDIEHEAFKGSTTEEKEISKTKIPAGKLIDATVKKLGKERYSTRVKGQINRNRADYKEIQGNLVEEYLDAFSVAFLPTEIKYIEKEGEQIRVLDDCILLNVALTGNPCNTKAQLVEVFTKSMNALEEYKKKKEIDPSIENNLIVKNKSHLTQSKDLGNSKLNIPKNSIKMTDDPKDAGTDASADAGNDEGSDAGDSNQESEEQTKMLKSVSENLKSLSDKYVGLKEENATIKEDMKAISENLAKVVKALEQPVHKSSVSGMTDAQKEADLKVQSEGKSVDPLSLF